MQTKCAPYEWLLFGAVYWAQYQTHTFQQFVLLFQKADIIIAPLTISYERQQVIDFTKPFMDLGLTFIMAKETPIPDIWAFCAPFEWPLWGAVIGAFVIAALATTACSYLSPYGYGGQYVQRADPKDTTGQETHNVLRVVDSLWFTYSSWMQQVSKSIFCCFESH